METDLKTMEQEQEKREGKIIYFPKGPGGDWTPEEKAEMRKQMHKKLNGLGQWYFSTCEPMIVVNNPEAVYGK
ncbi:MAG: hypothetical protein LUB83_00765 [Prevotellaceae bacterium]|nr:hypothetical protein [Prevotellaceae bacterium]